MQLTESSRKGMARILSIMVLLVMAGSASGRELLANGDFELSPDNGWRYDTWGNFLDTGNCHLRWRHDWDPDRDFEVMLHKMLHQGMRLSQKVGVEGLDLGFSVWCRLTSKTERESLFAAACVGIEYLDAADSVLGETRIYSATSGCTWENGPAFHLIRAPDSLHWYNYRLNIASELGNLPGVNPDSVGTIRVSLLSYVLDNC